MIEITPHLQALFASSLSLLCIKICGFIVQLYILSLIIRNLITKDAKKLWLLIIITIVSTLVIDANWIVKLLNKTGILPINFTFIAVFCQLGYPFDLLRYISFIIFLDQLIHKKSNLNLSLYYRISLATLTGICTLLAYEFAHFNDPSIYKIVIGISYPILYFYLVFALIPAIVMLLFRIKKIQLPRILNRQLQILIGYLVIPHIVIELITTNPFSFFTGTPLRSNYFLISISTIQLAFALYYCTKKMTLLRFLNTRKRVDSNRKFDFIKDFKEILDQLSHVTNMQELNSITQTFFESAFNIARNSVTLHTEIRELSDDIKSYSYTTKILILDEIEFSNFYDQNNIQSKLLTLLTTLQASIFLPIYEKQTLIGYIIVKNNKQNSLCTNVDQDEMIIFAGYIANTINIMRTQKIHNLIKQNKELAEEIYNKQQEIRQYKESIRSFLLMSSERKIGILFYKNNIFSYGNYIAQEQIALDLNQNTNHALVKTLKILARSTLEYKQAQSISIKESSDQRLMICAIPSLDKNHIIFTIYYPEVTDILALQKNLLKDPSTLDYLLYLETTKSGQLINQLIPGSGEVLLNFKINLLRMALSQKTILLDMAQEDIIPAVEILHHISLRSKLHIIHLSEPEKNYEIAFKLFGMNPLFGTEHQEPLLKALDNTGTLFIENIHFLSIETQEYLAQFLTYGFFNVFKTDKKIFSNVRVICSTIQNDSQESFSKNLLAELEKMVLSLPPLITLPHNELLDLADRFVEQVAPQKTYQTPFLNDQEKKQLINQNPLSITEFKELVQQQIQAKATETKIYHDSIKENLITDPEIAHAIKLGKKALKNKQVMSLLWNTFKSQSKIATLLSVNRSSINRRCKEYELTIRESL